MSIARSAWGFFFFLIEGTDHFFSSGAIGQSWEFLEGIWDWECALTTALLVCVCSLAFHLARASLTRVELSFIVHSSTLPRSLHLLLHFLGYSDQFESRRS
jgi:hypothetical protein